MESKVCSKCGATKQLNDKNFVPRGNGKYRPECRECKNEYNRQRHFAKHGNRRIERAEVREADPKVCSRCSTEKPLNDFNWHDKAQTRHKSHCKDCQSAYAKAYNEGGGSEVRKAYVEQNKEKYEVLAVKFRTEYKQSGKTEVWSRKHQLKQYGLTPEDYIKLLASQEGKCAICETENPGCNRKHFCVDHDHETGKVRGLLCFNCNVSIGKLGDTKESLQRALDYLTN